MEGSLLFTMGFTGSILLNACSGIKFISDTDPAVDRTKFKPLVYYGWEEESDQILTRLDKERIENSFAAEFKKRGFELVEDGVI